MSWGLGAEVHVTSATTTRPPELRLPKVLLALVCVLAVLPAVRAFSPNQLPDQHLEALPCESSGLWDRTVGYRPGPWSMCRGPRRGPWGSWLTNLWSSWSNLAATDPRTRGFGFSQRGEPLHCFLSQKNPSFVSGVWDQKEWAEDSLDLGVPVWASGAPEHDGTSVEGPMPLAPTGLVLGNYRAIEAQLQPVCPLWVCSWPQVQREAWGTPCPEPQPPSGCLCVPWDLSEAQMLAPWPSWPQGECT